ncbi:hypothetical protein [Vulcanisaeta sp. JCM 16159]|uniref:hypothetical protein n=1 Tax=Vulcanisaeta sp. JCM 16159 TaxID=1295371 RepID=UPI0006D1E489|nr:hypothetical protein [Vulcanisaeta sp. JCM 16159]
MASYMVYEYESGEIGLSQLPGDVVYIAGTGNGYNPGYWTDSGGQDPGSQTCTTSYSIGLTVGYSSSGPSSLTIACPGDTITLNPAGIATTVTQLGAAINNTWIMKPMQTANTQQNTLATDSWGAAYMALPITHNPQPTQYPLVSWLS